MFKRECFYHKTFGDKAIKCSCKFSNHKIISSKSHSNVNSLSYKPKRSSTLKCNLCSSKHAYWYCHVYKTQQQKYDRAIETNRCHRCYNKNHTFDECHKLICSTCLKPSHSSDICVHNTKLKQANISKLPDVNVINEINNQSLKPIQHVSLDNKPQTLGLFDIKNSQISKFSRSINYHKSDDVATGSNNETIIEDDMSIPNLNSLFDDNDESTFIQLPSILERIALHESRYTDRYKT